MHLDPIPRQVMLRGHFWCEAGLGMSCDERIKKAKNLFAALRFCGTKCAEINRSMLRLSGVSIDCREENERWINAHANAPFLDLFSLRWIDCKVQNFTVKYRSLKRIMQQPKSSSISGLRSTSQQRASLQKDMIIHSCVQLEYCCPGSNRRP